jgi:hypothetical protein
MSKVSTSKVSGVTRLAILAYEKVAKLERRVEEEKMKRNSWVSVIPDKDMEYYIKKTNEIQLREEEKLEKFVSKYKRRRARQ